MTTARLLPRLLVILVCSMAAVSAAEVFQYRQMFPTERGEGRALLWLPNCAPAIRGVVIAGSIEVERRFTISPHIRAACRAQGLGIIALSTGRSVEQLEELLEAFAEASGYQELRVVPWAFFGHSAGGPQARQRAANSPTRSFALIQHRGGLPGGEPPVDHAVPCLAMAGQFDEFGGTMRDEDGIEPAWMRPRDALVAYRQEDPRRLVTLVVEPGGGHFPLSERNARLAALFLERAAAARIPADWDPTSGVAPTLQAIDVNSGWLMDLDLAAAAPQPSAPVAAYQGDPAKAGWIFDQAMADHIAGYHQGLTGRQDQFLRWQDGHWLDAGVRHFFTNLQWVDDGATFQVHPAYADRVPGSDNNRPRWDRAGEEVGHAAVPIRVIANGGPIEAVGEHRLRIRYSTVHPITDRHRPTFLAFSPGDDQFRHTELIGMMPRGFRGLNRGAAQAITFEPLADIPLGTTEVPLTAHSDAALPVEFYIGVGPAVVEGSTLRITDLPPRASLPITIEVVAWQFGRGNDPQVRSAEPVTQRFQIVAP